MNSDRNVPDPFRSSKPKGWPSRVLAQLVLAAALLAGLPLIGGHTAGSYFNALADDDSSGASGGPAGTAGTPGGVGATSSGGEGAHASAWTRPRTNKCVLFFCSPPRARRTARRVEPKPARQLVRLELVAFNASPEARAAIERARFTIVAQDQLRSAPGLILRLRAPAGMNQRAAARRLGEVAPGTIIARNDRYRSFRLSTSREARTAKGRVLTASVSCAAGASIAMIDTDVDLAHPALAGSDIRRLAARAADRQASSSRHGTAVASMLVGRTESIAPGLAPGARLIAIDAFHRDASGQDATDAFDLARALDLLSGEDAQIINLSLTGPENGVIGRIVDVLLGQGRVIVAAAGNDGPRAKPLYPAAYPGVIAVTAVDGEGKPWRRAARGDHIAFAAMGVDLALAGRNGGAEAHTGTSFAAPAVAAMIAGKSTSVIRVAGDKPVETMTGRLAAVARDTGAPGRDPVFGFGILNPADACRTAAKPARE